MGLLHFGNILLSIVSAPICLFSLATNIFIDIFVGVADGDFFYVLFDFVDLGACFPQEYTYFWYVLPVGLLRSYRTTADTQ